MALKVLVIDDTVIYRKILSDVAAELNDVEVIGAAANGELALRKMQLSKPDLVLCDVEMPVMDGLETLRAIRRDYPDVGVIMVSGITERQADITLDALQNGAIDFIPKPMGNNFEANKQALKTSLTPIINLFQSRKALMPLRSSGLAAKPTTPLRTTRPEPTRPQPPTSAPEPVAVKPVTISTPLPTKFDVMVIGVSTGGPNALAKFIPELPADFPIPVLIVQHMPPMFTKSLATHLNAKAHLEIQEAVHEQPLEKGKVLIAPGGKHMIIQKNPRLGALATAITDTPPVNSCKPSVDVLFDSVPSCYPTNILSVVMTGMGADGTNGVRTMKKAGCYSVTQSEETCVVYGMPRAVVEAGLSDEVVPLERLAARVTELAKTGRRN